MTEDIRVDILPTPNPHSLMFRVSEVLVSAGSHEFTANEPSQALPSAIFKVEGIDKVLITRNFVTITKLPTIDWGPIVGKLRDVIADFIESGELAVPGVVIDQEFNKTESKIVELINDVRPQLQADGGDIEFVAFDEEGNVHVRLVGACGTCPHATATLAYGVQSYLMNQLPEVKGVVRVG